MSSRSNRYIFIIIGALLTAAGINVFYTPNGMVAGGVSGLGIIVMHYSEKYFGFSIPVSVTNLVLNIPLFIISYYRFGKSYIKRSALAVILLSIALEITLLIPTYEGDLMLAAIFGGILTGVGIGFVLNGSATTGGTEAAAHLLHSINDRLSVSDYIFIVDATVIVVGLFVFGAEKAMFAVISVFVASKCVSALTSGASTDKGAYIISCKSKDICYEIDTAYCGKISVLNSCQMYKNDYNSTLICVFSQNEISQLKETVKTADPEAFIILFDINEVFGKGFKKL